MRTYNDFIRRSPDYFKPKQFRHSHLTRKEVAVKLGVDPSWLYKMERAGKIPSPARVKRGRIEVRLYSPEQVEEIRVIKSKIKPGPKVQNGKS